MVDRNPGCKQDLGDTGMASGNGLVQQGPTIGTSRKQNPHNPGVTFKDGSAQRSLTIVRLEVDWDPGRKQDLCSPNVARPSGLVQQGPTFEGLWILGFDESLQVHVWSPQLLSNKDQSALMGYQSSSGWCTLGPLSADIQRALETH